MADYQKQLTFSEFYARKKNDYVLNRMESRESEFKAMKAYDILKKVIKAPLIIIKKTDDFNTSMADTASEKIVTIITTLFYLFIFYLGYQSLSFMSMIINQFKTYIEFIYNLKNTSLIVGLLFFSLFVLWFFIDHVVKKTINKLYRERSMRKMLIEKFNNDYDNKIANEDMIDAFVYYYNADIYKNALQKIYNMNGDKIYHKDLLNINKYI